MMPAGAAIISAADDTSADRRHELKQTADCRDGGAARAAMMI